MSTQWKPGDVAMVSALNKPEPYRAYYDGKTWREYGEPMFCVDQPQTMRHLVVVDPEDREAVERLWNLFRNNEIPNGREAIADALREFANPKPPRPEEPMGLGAVVEDDFGSRWVCVYSEDGDPQRWAMQGQVGLVDRWRTYNDVPVVRRLNDGVPND